MKKPVWLVPLVPALVIGHMALASSQTQVPGFTFDFGVSSDGQFSLEVDAFLASNKTVADAKRILSNPNNMVSVSDVVKAASLTPNSNGEATLDTVWKHIITKQLVSDCRETDEATRWGTSCTLRIHQDKNDPTDKGQTAGLFVSGGTDTLCTEDPDSRQVECRVKTFGQVKAFKFLGIGKSGPELALDGAGYNLHDFGLMLEMINRGESAKMALSEYSSGTMSPLVQMLTDRLNAQINSIPTGKNLQAFGDSRNGAQGFSVNLE